VGAAIALAQDGKTPAAESATLARDVGRRIAPDTACVQDEEML
jgi:hypothetical protein